MTDFDTWYARRYEALFGYLRYVPLPSDDEEREDWIPFLTDIAFPRWSHTRIAHRALHIREPR